MRDKKPGTVRRMLVLLAAVASASGAFAQDADPEAGPDTAPENAAPENAAPENGEADDAATDPAESAGPGFAPHNRDVSLRSPAATDTLTGDWFGRGDDLRELGITTTLDLWVTWQANLSGGLSTGDAANGLYWFATHFDLERMGVPGGSAFLLVEGGWDVGINGDVGALMNVNGTAIGNHPVGVTRLWYQQQSPDDRLRMRIGKFDVTLDSFEFHGRSVAFDAMPYANTERTQFLDDGLGNNAAVPFPEAGLGGMMLVEPAERWYIAIAGFDRNTDSFSSSFSTAFDAWMLTAETGVVVSLGSKALSGHYYAGYWYSKFTNAPRGQGFYLGAAQQLTRESDADDQGLGVFARYGYGYRNATGVSNFWSLGAQYRGLIPNRDDDILAIGWAQAFTKGAGFTAGYEGALELYYRASITPWFHVSPHGQFIANPGSNDVSDAYTIGVRAQISF